LSIETMTPQQDDAMRTHRMNRRQFLIFAAAAVVTGWKSLGDADGATVAHGERVVNAGPVGKYAADGLYDGFRDQGFFVVRQGKKLCALSSFCTHRKCKLEAEPDRSFSCPCHGSTFDPKGKVTQGPARRDLPMLPALTNETGQLLVSVPNA
jgi:Rieske Fe-S protein